MGTEQILPGLPIRLAIEAVEVTAIRQAHPQIAQNAPLRVYQRIVPGHCFFGGAGWLVSGGMTFTDPSALTSTFKS
jgi:hypothetical protein